MTYSKQLLHRSTNAAIGFIIFVGILFVGKLGFTMFAQSYPANWPGNKVTSIVTPIPFQDQDGDPNTPNIYRVGDEPIGLVTVVRSKPISAVVQTRTWCTNGYRDTKESTIALTHVTLRMQPVAVRDSIVEGMGGECFLTYDSTQHYSFLGEPREYIIHYETEIFKVGE